MPTYHTYLKNKTYLKKIHWEIALGCQDVKMMKYWQTKRFKHISSPLGKSKKITCCLGIPGEVSKEEHSAFHTLSNAVTVETHTKLPSIGNIMWPLLKYHTAFGNLEPGDDTFCWVAFKKKKSNVFSPTEYSYQHLITPTCTEHPSWGSLTCCVTSYFLPYLQCRHIRHS